MTAIQKQVIPDEVADIRDEVQKTETTYIRALTRPIDTPGSLTKSKLIGQPYMPLNTEYPTDENNEPMHFLAQINFSEAPELAPFPSKGMLQFYVANDDSQGLHISDPYNAKKQLELQTTQNNFRILYFPDVITNEDELVRNSAPECEDSPVMDMAELDFVKLTEYMPMTDFRFDQLFGEDYFIDENKNVDKDKLYAYEENISSPGCKIGGYPEFVQGDVRELTDNPGCGQFFYSARGVRETGFLTGTV